MKRYLYILGAALSLSVVSCSIDEPFEEPADGGNAGEVQVPQDVVAGELLVKFAPEVSEILDRVLPATKSGGPATRSGVVSVDDVLELVGTYQFERVFPKDIRTEADTREAGLHLWYVVRFSKEFTLDEVARRLSSLGEVQQVELNRTIKRAYSGKVTPFVPAAVMTRAGVSDLDDPLFAYQWDMVNNGSMFTVNDAGETVGKSIAGADVQVEKAWEKTMGDPSIIVAVLDEGVDFTHPDLLPNMWTNPGETEYGGSVDMDGNGYPGDRHGFNFVRNIGLITTNDVNDSGHGSHVAGVIAAQNNNGYGMASIAGGTPDKPGVKIMSCQIFSGNLETSALAQVRAVKYAADNGAVILQCSWGYISGAANGYIYGQGYSDDEMWMSYSPIEKVTFDYFIHNAGSPNGVLDGGLAIFAAGNESAPMACYPGKYGDYVSVASTAADWTPAAYTNYGPGTTICAPGGDQDYYWDFTDAVAGYKRGERGCILSTVPQHVSANGFGYMEGTSMACPHVSGVAALGLSYAAQLRKHFTADEFKELLYSTVTPAADIEKTWPSTKRYRDFSTEIENVPASMNLSLYKGQMGVGQVNAAKLLEAIEGAGTAMTFPNVYVAAGASATFVPAMYFPEGATGFKVSISDTSIAESIYDAASGKIVFKGLKDGMTKASISAGSTVHEFVITVRSSGGDYGWL
ncbi:MAG: S8 family serine peptidase [Bacteroidales bacterium]|nr:S8 family serine peptidase [Bacteroidales bacterium]